MKSRIISLSIIILWVCMTGWLVRYEAYPHLFARYLPGYRGLFASGPVILDAWMKITFQDVPIGYTHSQVDMNEDDPTEQYLMRNHTALDLNIMGNVQHLSVSALAGLDALYDLHHFSFSMSSDDYSLRMDARRSGEETFDVRIQSPAGSQKTTLVIPRDVVLESPLTEMALANLRPGQEIRMRTLDPATLGVVDVVVRALRTEAVMRGEEEVEVTVLQTEYQGMQVLTWMGADGQLIRQETPFGWTLESCTPEEAMEFRSVTAPVDLLRALAVPCREAISYPRGCRELDLRLSGMRLTPEELTTPRQAARSASAGVVDLAVITPPQPADRPLSERVPEELQPYVSATPFVQCDHPELVKKARQIVGDAGGRLEAARAIHDWVYRKVIKDDATTLPSALDVLQSMRGDCNEHTYLFVGLARAAGIPARICLGVVYLEDAFYYHAWPAVYVDGWFEMDPTFGQVPVDATHIFLVEGESASQLKLMGVIGQVEAEVLSARY